MEFELGFQFGYDKNKETSGRSIEEEVLSHRAARGGKKAFGDDSLFHSELFSTIIYSSQSNKMHRMFMTSNQCACGVVLTKHCSLQNPFKLSDIVDNIAGMMAWWCKACSIEFFLPPQVCFGGFCPFFEDTFATHMQQISPGRLWYILLSFIGNFPNRRTNRGISYLSYLMGTRKLDKPMPHTTACIAQGDFHCLSIYSIYTLMIPMIDDSTSKH